MTVEARIGKVVIMGGVVLLLVVLAGAGIYVHYAIRKAETEAAHRRHVSEYGVYLADAKNAIEKNDIPTALEKLQAAVALPEDVNKDEAGTLLKETQTVLSSPQRRLQGMSDADFQSLCSTGSLPQSHGLSYAPLNALYLEKLLAVKDDEASRRKKKVRDEAERKAKAEAERLVREEAERKARLAREEAERMRADALEGRDLMAWKLAYAAACREHDDMLYRQRLAVGEVPDKPSRSLMEKTETGDYRFRFPIEWSFPYKDAASQKDTITVRVADYGSELRVEQIEGQVRTGTVPASAWGSVPP